MSDYIRPHQRQRLEIALDVLKGCTYSCEGCMVDRDLYATTDVVDGVNTMVDGFIAFGHYPFDITIGATDFGSAVNVDQIANDPKIGELVRKFQTLTVTCPMLEKSPEYYERLANNLLRLSHGETFIRIVMPIGLNYMGNITLMSALKTRLDYLQTMLSGKLHEITFVLNVTNELIRKNDFKSFVGIYEWPDMDIVTDMVLNIPHGRQHDISTNPKYANEITDVSRFMSELYEWMDSDDVKQQDPDFDGFTGTHINLGIISDKIYVVPYLKDEFNLFSPGLVVDELTYESVMSKVSEIRDDDQSVPLSVCRTCPEAPYCIEKGIFTIIKELDMVTCPVNHNV